MPKVEQVCIQIARPDGDYPGQVSYGFYTVEGKKLTMTDSEGVPVRRRNGGLVQHELRDGENSRLLRSTGIWSSAWRDRWAICRFRYGLRA